MARFLPLIAIYATFCMVWGAFARWIAPTIIAAAYDGRIPSILNSRFQRSLPVEHYLDGWSEIAGAIQLAAILHLVIVLFIRAVDRKHRVLSLDTARVDSRTNIILVVFSAGFLAVSILAGVRGDYESYLTEWRDVLDGRNPWRGGLPYNAYGPLFNVLAPLLWITPLANKLLFAFAYLIYVIWLIKDFGTGRGLVTLSWPVVVYWLLNPFPWVEISYYGHLDVLVALACVAAVHGQARGKDVFSGICLATGVLLKYLPIVILPLLVFDKRRFRFRLFSYCAVLIIAGLFMSLLVWGKSTFGPLRFAAIREPVGSIYEPLSSANSPLRTFWDSPNVNWLEKLLLLTAGLGVFAWCIVRQTGPALSAALAVLVTLLFYRVGYINYQMVLFFLISYWAVTEWERLKKHNVLAALLISYFGLLGIVDIAIWLGLEGYSYYSTVVVLLKFFVGCALLASLIQFSARDPSLDQVASRLSFFK
jgi:hypothetical protein